MCRIFKSSLPCLCTCGEQPHRRLCFQPASTPMTTRKSRDHVQIKSRLRLGSYHVIFLEDIYECMILPALRCKCSINENINTSFSYPLENMMHLPRFTAAAVAATWSSIYQSRLKQPAPPDFCVSCRCSVAAERGGRRCAKATSIRSYIRLPPLSSRARDSQLMLE
jgi:hypothetical protein